MFCCCSLTAIQTASVYACESRTKGEFLGLMPALDVLYRPSILQLPEQNGSAGVSHVASQLEMCNDVLRKADLI